MLIGIVAMISLAMFASSVLAYSGPVTASASVQCTQASDCTTTILNLCAKDTNTWQCLTNGATATLTFGTVGPKFTGTLTTYGLGGSTEYALIYKPDTADRFTTWTGVGGKVIATFTGNAVGLAIDKDLGMNLPIAGDWNIAPSPDYCAGRNGWDYYAHCTGAKIWIVPTAVLTSGNLPLTAWNPTTYLFETDLVTYTKGSPTTTCVSGQCDPITCGIDLSGSPGFDSMVQGTTYQSPQTTTVTNTGNAPENPTISGDYWYGSKYITLGDGYWMPIGATQWYVSGWNTLTSTSTSIGTISPAGSALVYYKLTVPSPQPTDTYSQTITFGTGC